MPGFDFCAESVFPRATVYIVNNYMKALSYLQRANVLVNINSSSHQPCIFSVLHLKEESSRGTGLPTFAWKNDY